MRIGKILCTRSVGNADWNRAAFDLRRPAGHVAKEVDSERDIGSARHGKRLAIVEGFKFGKFFKVLLKKIGDLPYDSAAFAGGHLRPWSLFKGSASSLYGQIYVGFVACSNVNQLFACCRIERWESLP